MTVEREYNMGGDADLTDAAETLKASTFAERCKRSAQLCLMAPYEMLTGCR